MQKSNSPVKDALVSGAIEVTSPTIAQSVIEEILATPGIFFQGHYEYPVSIGTKSGNHLDSVFLIEPIAGQLQLVDAIVDDLSRWIKSKGIDFDVIFSPAQPAVMTIVNALAEKLGRRTAFWQYLPEGWFGDHIVAGEVKSGDKVLVFNGVTQQGRCVGNRLPEFVDQLGGETVAAAVFAKGTAQGVKQAEERFADKFYSVLKVDINVLTPETCQQCPDSKAIPWTTLKPR